MVQYKDFIAENVALPGVCRIGIYDSNGNRVGGIRLGSLALPEVGQKLYSFGALSDVHLQYETAQADFQRALTYLNEAEDVQLICISGDLTASGTNGELAEYQNHVATCCPETPVYAITGNHEAYRGSDLPNVIERYTGHPLYYSFAHGEDVFIMVGIQADSKGSLFAVDELQWLYETLEENRNKRCFLFQHVRPDDACGNALGIYTYDIWGGTEQTVFESLLRHYPNVVFFHGHSHLKFGMQQYSNLANIDKTFECWSIHIPSVSVPRGTTSVVDPSITTVYADSEGYVVDVYKTGIHLRGRDFARGRFLPIASYWLDTPVQKVAAGTYRDETGTINTGGGLR